MWLSVNCNTDLTKKKYRFTKKGLQCPSPALGCFELSLQNVMYGRRGLKKLSSLCYISNSSNLIVKQLN